MSRQADRERAQKRGWAEPGGRHDALIKFAKIGLPILGVMLLFALLLAPLAKDSEVSFILDKEEVDQADERLRVEKARYRGEDNKGQPFEIIADRAIQETSAEQVVQIQGMAAQLQMENGDLRVTAPRGRYDIEAEEVRVDGPLRVRGPDGYRLDTRDVRIDLDTRTLRSEAGVEGAMRLGQFEAGRLEADLDARTVTLSGRARLKIEQGAVR